jgi:rhamnosyl/mannosyltransferase
MRILQLGKYYEPEVGGIETHLGLLTEGLAARGVDIEVLVHGAGARTVREHVRGIHVTRVGAMGRLLSTELAPSLVTELNRHYDILHLHTPHPMAMLAYLAARKPPHALVITHHSDIIRQARLRSVLGPLFRSVLSRADAIIATSNRYLESSEELRPYRSKVKIIPFGIDISKFTPSLRDTSSAKKIRRKYGDRIVLSTGRLIYYKGFEVLIDAMQGVPGHLLIIGEGPLRSTLERRARLNGLSGRVTFLGAVSDEEMGQFYGAADVFALASTARSEAFGIVQIEALASALPVVNTELSSGVPEVSIDGVTGITVRPNDRAHLAEALNTLLGDPTRARALGTKGRQRAVERFTADRMVDDTFSLYREVTSAPPARAERAVLR